MLIGAHTTDWLENWLVPGAIVGEVDFLMKLTAVH